MSTLWSGSASYFDCITTSACGSCISTTVGVAWPHLTGPRQGFRGTCFSNVPAFCCGTVITVENTCNHASLGLAIVDFGPGTGEVCHNDFPICNKVKQFNQRLIDLTRAAFVQLGGNLNDGLMNCLITTP